MARVKSLSAQLLSRYVLTGVTDETLSLLSDLVSNDWSVLKDMIQMQQHTSNETQGWTGLRGMTAAGSFTILHAML